MKDLVSSHVHSSWRPIFKPLEGLISEILLRIDGDVTAPSRDLIFHAFSVDLESIRCVIIGQDPYPTPGNAMGLAFSVPPNIEPLPQSLRNIFTELESDIGITSPSCGDLSPWMKSGVLLLNRVLTTRLGESDAHKNVGWQEVTDHIAAELGRRDVVAILWGSQARELSKFFRYSVTSVHPSPLSAYRGFFGSKPFSQVNEILTRTGRTPINWSL
jgi:uracil-DNA glycosylase